MMMALEVTQCIQATVQIPNITCCAVEGCPTEQELNLSCIPINATFSIIIICSCPVCISKQDLSVCIAVYALCTLCSLLRPPHSH